MKSQEILRFVNQKKAFLEEKVEYGIETGRRGRAFLSLTDAAGKPLAGAKIRLQLKKHAFQLGCNLFLTEQFESEELNARYENAIADCFTLATVPFYWLGLEPEEGKPRYTRESPFIYRRPPPDVCLELCERHGIEPKAHCLNYQTFVPEWTKRKSVPEEKAILVKHFRELAERYAARIPSWEVTNETFWCGTQRHSFYRSADYIPWSFKTAAQFFPGNSLIINEGHYSIFKPFPNTRGEYWLEIKDALAQGCRIDVIGMQYHLFESKDSLAARAEEYLDPERIYDALDAYAQFGRKLQITEITVPAYRWEKEDEELQAEILRLLITMWFSHPAMSSAVYWNLVDGYAYVPPGTADVHDMKVGENAFHGGLLRRDLSPKPAYTMLRKLFQETWTTDTSVETDADGRATFRGFYGDYEATVTMPDGSVKTEVFRFDADTYRHFDFVI